ncbi:hypothetical protein AVEN_110527-1 [Araneus ventricosus]|uniref:Uncharacterized protein n=1 Tax=Araneus ventricosus TaxID=182803 RepID=A0A4Y2GVG7_ARAVE|nr:hypothetical protein AVEN_110527-1 [Araneus ventricosus]
MTTLLRIQKGPKASHNFPSSWILHNVGLEVSGTAALGTFHLRLWKFLALEHMHIIKVGLPGTVGISFGFKWWEFSVLGHLWVGCWKSLFLKAHGITGGVSISQEGIITARNPLTSRAPARNQSKNQKSTRPERPAYLMLTQSPFASTSCVTAFSRVPFQPCLTGGISSPGERLS